MQALLFLIVVLLLFFTIKFVISFISNVHQSNTQKSTDNNSKKEPEKMIACEVCQLRLPESEALCNLEKSGKKHYFCSQKHKNKII